MHRLSRAFCAGRWIRVACAITTEVRDEETRVHSLRQQSSSRVRASDRGMNEEAQTTPSAAGGSRPLNGPRAPIAWCQAGVRIWGIASCLARASIRLCIGDSAAIATRRRGGGCGPRVMADDQRLLFFLLGWRGDTNPDRVPGSAPQPCPAPDDERDVLALGVVAGARAARAPGRARHGGAVRGRGRDAHPVLRGAVRRQDHPVRPRARYVLLVLTRACAQDDDRGCVAVFFLAMWRR